MSKEKNKKLNRHQRLAKIGPKPNLNKKKQTFGENTQKTC